MAELWFWVVYWALSLLFFAMILFGPDIFVRLALVFLVQFFTFLVLMRMSNNEMSLNCWCGFWFSLSQILPLLRAQFKMPVYLSMLSVATIARFCISSDYLMPNAAFCILIFFLSTSSPPRSLGSFIWYSLYIFNNYIDRRGIHSPVLRISHYITVPVLLALIFLINPSGYRGAILAWLVSMVVLRSRIWPWNEDFGWLWAVRMAADPRFARPKALSWRFFANLNPY